MSENFSIAVIGSGYWGTNYVRLASQLPDIDLVAVCDKDPDRLHDVANRFPKPEYYLDYHDIPLDSLKAVIVCTNPSNHYEISSHFLAAKKHVLVEKPMTLKAEKSRELIQLANSTGATLMVGHIFLYNPGIQKVKSLIQEGAIGQLHYLYSRRTNLGPIRDDVNALWDLAPHDISIFSYLLDSSPEWASAVGACFLRDCNEDAGFITLGYPDGKVGNIHVSWADPNKEREIVIVGSQQRIVFNDVSLKNKVKIFEKGVAASSFEPMGYGEFQLLIRDGDIVLPRTDIGEPLKIQLKHFVECVKTKQKPLTDGKNGLEVVQAMEAITESVHKNGSPIEIKSLIEV
jgi:predicted dehydrogenase